MWVSSGWGKVFACAISMAASPLLTAASDPIRAQTQVDSGPLRVDGLYRAPFEKDYRFYRFYKDGTVVTVEVSADFPKIPADKATQAAAGHARRAGLSADYYPVLKFYPVTFVLTGTYHLKGNDVTFDGRRCQRCPVEERYQGRITGERLELQFSGEVRNLGRQRKTLSAAFVELALPADPAVPPVEASLTTSERDVLDRLAPATIQRPKIDIIEAIRAARTVRFAFGVGNTFNVFGTHRLITQHSVFATLGYLGERAGLSIVDTGEADLVLTVDRLDYVRNETRMHDVLGSQISGRITVSTSARSTYQTGFKGTEKGPWFAVGNVVGFNGVVEKVAYEKRKVVGDAFAEGLVRTMKAILQLRLP